MILSYISSHNGLTAHGEGPSQIPFKSVEMEPGLWPLRGCHVGGNVQPDQLPVPRACLRFQTEF